MGLLFVPVEGLRELFDGDEDYISTEGIYSHHQEQAIAIAGRVVGWGVFALPVSPMWKALGTAYYYGTKIPLALDSFVESSARRGNEVNSINSTQGGGRTLSQQTGSVVMPSSSTSRRRSRTDYMSTRDSQLGGTVRVPR